MYDLKRTNSEDNDYFSKVAIQMNKKLETDVGKMTKVESTKHRKPQHKESDHTKDRQTFVKKRVGMEKKCSIVRRISINRKQITLAEKSSRI